MHIIAHNQDEVATHRELQRQLRAGEITPAEYRAAYHTIAQASDVTVLCHTGDGRLATVTLGGKPICSACWVAAAGRTVRR